MMPHTGKNHSGPGDDKNEFSEIKDSYDIFRKDLPRPPADSFDRIMQKIDAAEEKTESESGFLVKKHGLFSRLKEMLKDYFAAPKTAWAVAGVQMAVIVILVIAGTWGPENASYQTLSTPSGIENKVHLNIVFNDSAVEADIRALLNGVQARIVDGPALSGLYVIEVDADRDLTEVMTRLESAGVVEFVQKKM